MLFVDSKDDSSLLNMHSSLELLQGDITTQKVDAIVNAANRALSGGGGVDGAIHRAAGPELVRASRALGPCDTGDAKLTPGYNLPARYVIHAVGPVWQGGEKNEPTLLASCYQRAFEIANTQQFKSIAFPSISTGAYGYPLAKAAQIAIDTIMTALETSSVEKVVFVCFDRKTLKAYQKAYQQWTAT